MATRKGTNRYPRPGERIAPATLSHLLMEPVAQDLAAGTAAEGLHLADLDERTWERLPAPVIGQLAEIVVARVAAACNRLVVHQCHLPRIPDDLRLDQLRLEHRTRHCLARAGFLREPGRLGGQRIGDILSIRGFGPRCLVDLLSALESRLARPDSLHEGLTQEARRLAELPGAEFARRDDPRFAALIRQIDAEAPSARHLADRLISRSQDPPDPASVAQQVRGLRERILAMPATTLEQELIQIFGATPNARNREIMVSYYGWKDGKSHTLAEIGARYGMTRERTRQICAKLVKRADPAAIPAPVLDRTLAFLDERLPRSVAALEEQINQEGLTAVGLRLASVAAAARLLGRPVPFRLVGQRGRRLAVRPWQVSVCMAVLEAAKKQVYYHGLTTVDQIVKVVAPQFAGQVDATLAAETLQLTEGFCWLDPQSGWFRLEKISRHGLPRTIEKVLAVAGRVRVDELAAAVRRSRRTWPSPPPNVLLEFCRQTPGLRVQEDWIHADPPQAWEEVLTGVEARLVRVLKQHGPVVERGRLEELCIRSGMNRFSFHAFIACSPVIVQYGPSVYGLIGAKVSPEAVESLVARSRAERGPRRVLDGHGCTQDGRIWLSYRLSKAASTYAVITVPAALKELVCGKFELFSAEGRSVGVLAAKDGRAWGLGAFLRQQGARIDDCVLVTLDLQRRQAVIAINGAWGGRQPEQAPAEARLPAPNPPA